jgi:hypothetical protein
VAVAMTAIVFKFVATPAPETAYLTKIRRFY